METTAPTSTISANLAPPSPCSPEPPATSDEGNCPDPTAPSNLGFLADPLSRQEPMDADYFADVIRAELRERGKIGLAAEYFCEAGTS